MVAVIIGDAYRSDDNISERWIAEQINRRKENGVPICIKIQIDTDYCQMGLASPACSVTRGTYRQLNEAEKEICDLWSKLKLNTDDFSGGNLIAFLKQSNLI